MSRNRKSEAAERADAEVRALLAEQDARWQVRQEQDWQRSQAILNESRQDLARDRLESEALAVENYRRQAVAQVTSSKTVAPQFIAFITGTSKEQIDQQIEQAVYATAEIVSELAGQGEPTVQSRDEATGQFIPQAPQPTGEQIVIDKSLSMRDYLEKVRPAMNIGQRDAGIFS